MLGNKVKCVCDDRNCNPCQDYLIGTAPFCAGGNGNCKPGWKRAGRVKSNCFSGSKTYCQCDIRCVQSASVLDGNSKEL